MRLTYLITALSFVWFACADNDPHISSRPDEPYIDVDTSPSPDTDDPGDVNGAPQDDASPVDDTDDGTAADGNDTGDASPGETRDDTTDPEDDTTDPEDDTTDPEDDTTDPEDCESCLAKPEYTERADIVHIAERPEPLPASDPPRVSSDGKAYQLIEALVYTGGTFSSLIQNLTIEDGGHTLGAMTLTPERWLYAVALDLNVKADTFIGPMEASLARELRAGGCYAFTDNVIRSDASACSEGWPDGITPPIDYAYAYNEVIGHLILDFVISPEMLTRMLPQDQQDLAQYVITGPMTLRLTFLQDP